MKSLARLQKEFEYACERIPDVEAMLADLTLQDLPLAYDILEAVRPDLCDSVDDIVKRLADSNSRPLGLYLVSGQHRNDSIREYRYLAGLIIVTVLSMTKVAISLVALVPMRRKPARSLLRWSLDAIRRDFARGSDNDVELTIRTGDGSHPLLVEALQSLQWRHTGQERELIFGGDGTWSLFDCWSLDVPSTKPRDYDDDDDDEEEEEDGDEDSGGQECYECGCPGAR